MRQVAEWLRNLLRDPDGDPSSSRVAALICTLTGCGVAITGMILGREQSATVVALLGGGAASLFARRKSTETEP